MRLGVLCVALLGLLGCAKRPPPQSGYVVKKITFDGNSGVLAVNRRGLTFGGATDYNLRAAMTQEQSDRLVWLAPRRRRAYLDEEALRLDAWRLETWYAHNGYFDARFLGWDVTVIRDEGHLRPPTVRIQGRLLEGAPTFVGVRRPLRLPADMDAALWEEALADTDLVVARPDETPLAEVRLTDGAWSLVVLTASGEDGRQIALEPPTTAAGRRAAAREAADVLEGHGPQAVELQGFESLSVGAAALLSNLRKKISVQPGMQFSMDAVSASEQVVLSDLRERSYARAQVRSEVTVWPADHLAQVRIVAEEGPDCTFGQIDLVGSFDIPIDTIEGEIAFAAGQPYKASLLAETQQRLFSLGVFSVVNVVPMLDEAPDSSAIPVRIFLTERQPQQLKVGGGLLLESGKQDIHTSTTYSHANIGNRLIRLEGTASAGYTVIGDVNLAGVVDELNQDLGDTPEDEEALSVTDQGFTYGLETKVTVPRPLGWRRGEIELSSSLKKVIEPSYAYLSPQVSPGVTWKLAGPFTLQAAYGLSAYIFQNTEEGAQLDASLPVTAAGDRYVLSELRQSVTYDTRDNPLGPTRGGYGLYELTEAGGALGGQYSFLRAELEQRRYLGMSEIAGLRLGGRSERGRRLTLRERFDWYPRGLFAFRAGGGAIFFPYGAESTQLVPLPERLYLGGASDIRGWARKQLGPYVCDASAGNTIDIARFGDGSGFLDRLQGQDVRGYGCDSIDGYATYADEEVPIGGRYSVFWGAEFRRYFWESYGVVAFTDLGMVFLDGDEIRSEWQRFTQAWPSPGDGDRFLAQTVGLGIRYKTPIGPLRIDAAYRLDQDPRFRSEQDIRFHIALGESF